MVPQQTRQCRLSASILLALFATVFTSFTTVSAYPMLHRLEKKSKKCIEFNYPEMNIVDIVIVALPYDVEQEAVDFYSKYYGEYVDYGEKEVPRETSEENKQLMKGFSRSGQSPGALRFQVQCQDPEKFRKKMKTEFSTSLLFHRPAAKYALDNNEGQLCISNQSREFVKFIVAVVATETEWIEADEREKIEDQLITKESHIIPIEKELKKIIRAGYRVKKEMDKTDGMEKRMKQTNEGTQKRVKLFSYLSIAILVLTSFVQSRYLKTFFQKKKVI